MRTKDEERLAKRDLAIVGLREKIKALRRDRDKDGDVISELRRDLHKLRSRRLDKKDDTIARLRLKNAELEKKCGDRDRKYRVWRKSILAETDRRVKASRNRVQTMRSKVRDFGDRAREQARVIKGLRETIAKYERHAESLAVGDKIWAFLEEMGWRKQ